MEKLIIIGASGHGKVIADIALKCGYKDIAFLDDNISLTECAGFPVVGTTKDANMIEGDKIIAIGNAKIRESLQKSIKNIVTLIHPNAVISRRVKIGRGTVVMADSVINSDAEIGEGCIVNTCASIDHDCKIGNYVHISVGSHVAGTVEIGDRTWIGAGATVINNINICGDCMIGAGAVVINDIKTSGTYIGIPARKSREKSL